MVPGLREGEGDVEVIASVLAQCEKTATDQNWRAWDHRWPR